ncbi:something about silencing protein 10 [Trichonephila clavata]|uniref:Something about silencing protein 10 n=1 Tax=Trichonephila clavata TaxID=2740835 RepID=A0A8X6GR69_TRICU|nr:something about silencing protein 10 [Trichonephila clavata]
MKTNTAYSYLFNFSLYDFNSHRSSLTYSQPFHFRIRDLINDLNLNIGRIALCKISEVPPWKVIYLKVDFTLSCYSKACTPESTYRTLYLEHKELFSDYEPIFTDGSKSESNVGLAVVSLSTVITDALPISASIYTAKLHALRIAIEHISLSCGKKFIIYTDSLSTLQSIVSLHSSSHPILVDITYALANHLKKKDIRFCWIPGHAGIIGNELADTAARSSTGSSERFPIPHSDLKACFRQKLQSVWQSNWDQQTENKLHSVMPVLAPTVPSSSNRREQVIWTRLHLGHTRLTHRHLLFGELPPYCEICLPSRDVWGKKKYAYYNADFVDEDRGKTYREEDAEKARAEAEEALAIQKSVSSYADVNITELFQLETAEDLPKEESDEDAKLDSLDHVQKMKLLKKKSPELLLYIDEYLEKMEELKDKFLPLISFVQKVELPSEACAHYIKIKYQALLHYCMNISFYMSLRSKGPVHISHPIIRRINSFKDILDHLNNVNKTFKKEIDILVKKLKNNEEISFTKTQPSTETNEPITEENLQNISILENLEAVSKDGSKRKRDKESMSKQFETQDEKEILSLYQQFKDLKKQKVCDVPLDMEEKSMDEEMEEDFHAQEETDGKRNITYDIAKNKGLTVKQKKHSKIPRVKNRMKFRKAQIKRKGQVRGVIRELKRYDGEPTGISSHVVRSVKYK